MRPKESLYEPLGHGTGFLGWVSLGQ